MKQISTFFESRRAMLNGFALLMVGLVIGAAAQATILFSVGQPEFWDIRNWWAGIGRNASPLGGLLLYVLAGFCIVQGLRALGDTLAPITIPVIERQARRPRFGFWATSLGLAVFALVSAAQSSANSYGHLLTAAWLASLLLFIISVALDEGWRLPSAARMWQWFKDHRVELLVIVIVFLTGFIIRFFDVELHPYSFVNDEGEMGRIAVCILNGSCANLFGFGWATQPILAFFPYSLGVLALGNTALAIRLVSVITGAFSVLAVYLFCRDVFDKKVASVAALLLAVLPPHVHFSRIGVDNIVDSLSTPLVLWLLFRGLKRGSIPSFLVAGVVSGLCMYTYPGTRLAPFLGLIALAGLVLQVRGLLRANWRGLLIFVLAAFITAAPILGTFAVNFDIFTARMTRENIFGTGILAEQQKSQGINVIQALAVQFFQSSLPYIATGAPSNFYNSPRPYFTPLAAIFLMLGLVYTLWRIKDPRFVALFVWFWAAILLGSTITGGPPSTQRMMMSMPAAAILAAIGFVRVVDAFAQAGTFLSRLRPILLLAFVLFIGYQDITFYFDTYRAGHFFEDPTNELTYETRILIAPLHRDGRFYLLGGVGIPYLSFANFTYFAPDVPKDYLDEVTPASLAALPKDKDLLFIATTDRTADLELLASLMPGGEWSHFNRRYQPNQLLFTSYKIPKELLQTYQP